MNRIPLPAASALMSLALLAAASAAHATGTPGDAARGATVFATDCAECHSVKEGKDKKGPSLFGIVGRAAASHPGFAYSDALKAAPRVWTPEALSAYLANPKQAVPGGKMKYDGLPAATARADLIAYLAAATQ